MNKWLEGLKQLDTKNPGNWPWPVKIAALGLLFVAILVAGYFVFYQNQLHLDFLHNHIQKHFGFLKYWKQRSTKSFE